MLSHFYRIWQRTSPVLLVALLLLTVFGPTARAENDPDMSFSLEVSQDVDNNYTFTLSCQNNTPSTLGSVYAYLPLDNRLEYQYYISNSLDGYVRRAVPERLEVAFNTVAPGSCAVVQIVLKRVPNSRGTWTVAATGHWDGEPSPDGVQSDSFTLDFHGSPPAPPANTLQGGGTAKAGDTLTFTGGSYFGNERVSLWINLTDGRVLPFSGDSTTLSDGKGQIQFTVQLPKDAPPGLTTVVAFGQSSKLTSIGYVTVE
ncbi:MAG: hypothetical protein WCS37_04140 [Chloroflexota bacterium]